MKNSCINFLSLTDIPEIFTKISTCTSCNIHLRVILIAALRTFPLKIIVDLDLAVIAAHLAVVALGVELGILDVVIDKADHLFQRLQIVAHVGDLHIGDGAAGGDLRGRVRHGRRGPGGLSGTVRPKPRKNAAGLRGHGRNLWRGRGSGGRPAHRGRGGRRRAAPGQPG